MSIVSVDMELNAWGHLHKRKKLNGRSTPQHQIRYHFQTSVCVIFYSWSCLLSPLFHCLYVLIFLPTAFVELFAAPKVAEEMPGGEIAALKREPGGGDIIRNKDYRRDLDGEPSVEERQIRNKDYRRDLDGDVSVEERQIRNKDYRRNLDGEVSVEERQIRNKDYRRDLDGEISAEKRQIRNKDY